jgi:hypothetical protein
MPRIPSRDKRRAWSAKHPIVSSALFAVAWSAFMFLVLIESPHSRWYAPWIFLPPLLVLSFVGFFVVQRRAGNSPH